MVKKLTKRFAAFFLAFVFTAALLPTIPAMAATSGTCGDNLTWTLDDEGTLTISGTGDMTNWRNYSNTPWYSNRGGIKTVVIENGVTSIGRYTFDQCTALKSVTIPDSIIRINYYAFSACTALTDVCYTGTKEQWNTIIINSYNDPLKWATIYYNYITNTEESATSGECGENLTWTLDDSGTLTISGIGDMYCWNSSVYVPWHINIKDIKTAVIESGVTSIGKCAFSDCTGLTSVTIPDSVTSIGWYAFEGCTGLTSVTIFDGVTHIGDSAFSNCSGLTSVTIPDTVTSIGKSAFSGCSGLTSIIIPDSVTRIGDGAFSDCSGLTSITIPNSVTEIGRSAFSGCSGLTSITIPDSVTEIGWFAFSGCSSLISIAIDENNENYCSVDGNLFNKGKTELIQYAVGKKDILYTVPDSVIVIERSAFLSCTSLTSVEIPDSVTWIGNSAFSCCTALTDVYYKGTKEQWNAIGINSGNTPLTSATIHYRGEKIPTIGEYADKLDIVITKTGGEVKVELTAKGDTEISADDIQVFAMPASGNASKLAQTVDGDKIVYSGNIAGENYRIFVWTKDLVPITNVIHNV